MTFRLSMIVSLALASIVASSLPVHGFAPSFGATTTTTKITTTTTATTKSTTTMRPTRLSPLQASAGKNKPRRRRRRTTTTEPVKENTFATEEQQRQQHDVGEDDDDDDDDDDDMEIISEKEELSVEKPTGYEFQPPKADPAISSPYSNPSTMSTGGGGSSSSSTEGPIPLPDIRDQLKRKELQEKIAKMEEEEKEQKVKIKRSDKAAFIKLLESQPFADADDSFFEEEAYGTVSALLGERAKPFLGIPTGPLQVGHFIGTLAIMLMAFVEYPGFPLTNLPTPIRDALAGGLGTVYAINAVLAAVSVFKARERGQPVPFWMVKTFTVGGLAYDQLTQLPTVEEIEKVQAMKGARALKNRKK